MSHTPPHLRAEPIAAIEIYWAKGVRRIFLFLSLRGAPESPPFRAACNSTSSYRHTSAQPLRKAGLRYLLASALLVIFILAASYSILPSTRSAITPSNIHSTNGAATLKLEQAGSPPLAARIQS